jgi:hypothetical protein
LTPKWTGDRMHKLDARQMDRKKGNSAARRGPAPHYKEGLQQSEVSLICIRCARRGRAARPPPIETHRQGLSECGNANPRGQQDGIENGILKVPKPAWACCVPQRPHQERTTEIT